MPSTRTPAREKAKYLAQYLRQEHPDYEYLRSVFRYLREELGVEVTRTPKPAPQSPGKEALQRLDTVIAHTHRTQERMILWTFLFTDIRVSELVAIRCADVDLAQDRIHLRHEGQNKTRVATIPAGIRKALSAQLDVMRARGATYLFESSRQKPYSDRGIRKMLARYAEKASIDMKMTPHQLRQFFRYWLEGRDAPF